MTRPGNSNKQPDPLSVQVAFRLRLPKNSGVIKEALNQAFLRWVDTGELPKSIEIRGIFWRNSARKGSGANWRFSSGSDLSALKRKGVAVDFKSGTGDHELARETLKGALRQLRPF